VEQKQQRRARMRDGVRADERRRPERGAAGQVTPQDATVDVNARRRQRLAVRFLTAIEAGGRYLLIALLLPLSLLPALLRPRDFARRVTEAPSRLRSSARRVRISSKDPRTRAGRFAEASKLSLHFVREELTDMQDGFPTTGEVAAAASGKLRWLLERGASMVGFLPGDRGSEDATDRLFHSASLGLIGGVVVVGIFVSSFGGMEALKSSGRMSVQHVEVLGLGQVGEAEFLEKLKARVGDNLLELDLAGLKSSAAEHPWVEKVEVTRNLRDQTITFRAVERRPALLLAGLNLKLVDDRGRVFKSHEAKDPVDFPVLSIEGEVDRSTRRAALDGAIAILHALSAGRVVTTPQLSEIRFSEAEGFTLVTRTGLPIQVGREDFSARLGRLERAVGMGELPLDAVAMVDVSLRDRLVVVPRATKKARRVLNQKVKSQPVAKERRSRMLHLRRVVGDVGQGELTL
jgi:cell division septal protein FtsQ